MTQRIGIKAFRPLIPAVVRAGVFFVALWSLLTDSFTGSSGKIWSLAHYQRFLSDPFYLGYLLRSIRVATLATVVALLIGYPMAYTMSRSSPFVRRSLTLLLIFQFFTVTITRVYALLLVMGNNGLINRPLLALGLRERPLPLVNHEVGVVIGLVAAALPFAVFPIFSTLMGLRTSLEEAAATLGAARGVIFWRIVFPLSLPGVVASSILVFLYSLGAFLTPSLVGGGFVDLVAGFASEQAILMSNFGFAAAGASITLLAAFVLVLGIQTLYRQVSREA